MSLFDNPPPWGGRANREFAAAEAAEQALANFHKMTPCEEPGCTQWATPKGQPYQLGMAFSLLHPRGTPYFVQEWTCPAGHHYHREVPGGE